MHKRLAIWLRRAPRNEYAVAAVVLALLTAIFFAPIFVSGKTFSTVADNQAAWYPWFDPEHAAVSASTQSDQATAYYPWEVLAERSLAVDGQVPLWDRSSFAGHPLFANGQSGLAYPPRLALAWLTGPSATHDIYVVLHVLAAGLAMFALMKQLRARLAGALLAAVAWAFSSYLTSWIQLENFGAVAVFLPLSILAIRRWHDRRSWPDLLLGGLVLGALFLGGSPELSLACYLTAAAYCGALAVARLVKERHSLDPTARVGLLAAPVVLVTAGVAVAAVSILPFLELLGRSQRSSVPYDDLVRFSKVPPSSFLHAFWPPDRPLTAKGLVSQQTFVGTVTVLLAGVGIVRRRASTVFAGVVLLAVFLFTIGTPVTWLGHHLVPGLDRLLNYGRLEFLWAFALAILGGFGLDAIGDWWTAHSRAAPRRRVLFSGVATACIAVTALQLVVYGRQANPPFQDRTRDRLLPTTPAAEVLADEHLSRPGGGRVVPLSYALPFGTPYLHALTMPGATATAVGLRSVAGYESVLPGDSQRLWNVLAGEPLQSASPEDVEDHALPLPLALQLELPLPAFAVYHLTSTRLDLLARLGVSAVVAPREIRSVPGWDPASTEARGLDEIYAGPDAVVFEVVDAAPRALVVSDAVRAESPDDALEQFVASDFDVRTEVILEEGTAVDGVAEDGARGAREAPPQARVVWERERANDLRLRVTTEREGWLVVLDSYDPGWRATVDGRGVDIEQANFNFRAVRVPAGTSTVSFTYRPPRFVLGAWVSVLSTLTIVTVAVGASIRRRRRAAPTVAPRG